MFDSLQIDPVAFTIPIGDGFDIFWYGILVVIGISIGAWWAAREVARRGEDPDELYTALLVVVIAGYFFARLTYVALDVIDGAQYDSIGDVLNIRRGGANILGGFAGATLAALLYVRFRRLKLWHYADVAGPALLIAQAIGRWGNFINQELYGGPTGSSWGILIDNAVNRVEPYRDLVEYPLETTRFHPTFFYESIWLLVGFGLLLYLNRRFRDQWKPGVLFGVFLIWWGGGRTWIEFFRADQPRIGESPITYSMLLALALAVAGVLVILNRTGRIETGRSRRRRSRRRRLIKPKPRRGDGVATSENE